MVGPRALIATALAACALAAAILVPAPAAAAAPISAATSPVDTFEDSDCPVDVPREHERRVTCSVLTVPERRSPGSDPAKTLRLPVAVITSESPIAADPLVFPTSGGPGGGSLTSLWYFLDYADWAEGRDIILIEQRGDALAEPSLDCPELDTEHFIEDGAFLQPAAQRARRNEQVEACRARLTEEGIDLSAYTSAESVADLADLRAALGYNQWDLYGVSYGARLALTAMRDRPDGLRAVILDGVYPPHINKFEQEPGGLVAAIETLEADCAAQTECRERYPDLAESLAALLESADENPLTVTVKHPVDRSPVTRALSDEDIVAGLFNAFYDADTIRALPYLIDRLAAGDAGAAIPLAQRYTDDEDVLAEGLNLSIECAEEAPFNDDERIAAALAADPLLAHWGRNDGFREDCARWNVPPLPEGENAPVVSAIPTLLTTGGYDPVTPVAYAGAAAEHLSVRYIHTFPGQGHGAVWTNWVDDCAAKMAGQFLIDPAVAPDASCVESMPPTEFLTDEDIHPTSAVYRLNGDVIQDRDPLQIAIAGSTILTFLATLVYAAIYGLGWLGRRHGEAPGGLVLVAATAALLNLLYIGGMTLVLTRTDQLILAFGLPTGIWPLLLVPFVALAATVLLIVSLARAWMQEEGTRFHRIVLSVSALAGAGFAIWLLARGLLLL
ncbi:MAG TPA: alpha/beta hydrolase [Microbacterium sp.]|nr:alpha/beta hydrolase [Microbacterium sp.]